MSISQHQENQFIQADFFDNTGGINNTDAPFRVQPGQSIAGSDYDYLATGGLQKRFAATLLNSVADTQTRSLGFALNNSTSGSKTLLRAAGTKLQSVDTSSGACTNISDDLASPSSNFFTSTQPVVFSQFNTQTASVTWAAGGGLASGVVLGYNGTKATKNGSNVATGSLTDSTVSGTQNLPTGTYIYAIALVKGSTGAVSNAALDHSVSVTNGAGNVVRISFTSLTSLDTTKYTSIRVYRSVISGVTGFTTGDLIGTVASTATHFDDDGSISGTAVNVPRAGNTILDNSVLPSGTYNTISTWKRRLVTAQNSTIYISDLDKPESWPTPNFITIPSGGNITALGIISFSTPTSATTDEFLVIFKERETWVLTGSSITDWALKFVDFVGCPAQPLLVTANGFLAWIDYRGVYLWDGSYKPIYCSRLIEYDFGNDGDIDLSKLTKGWGTFFKKQNEIIWYISSIDLGEQKLGLKLDVRLTYPTIGNALAGRVLDGIFIKDSSPVPLYAGLATLPNTAETFYSGDNSGYIYKLYDNINSDNGTAIPFSIRMRSEDFGKPGVTKRFHKVVVWCRDSTLNDLILNYWTTYKTDDAHMSTQRAQVTSAVTNAYWDQATWDTVYWDASLVTYSPVVFNLGQPSGGVEGDALTLEFSQPSANSPITIAGYTVYYTVAGVRK